MNLGFQAHAGHAHRLLDPLLVVDDILLRKYVQDLLVRRYRHGLRRVDHPLQVVAVDLLVLDRDDTVGIEAANMAAGDTHVDRVNLAARHQFRLFHGPLDRLHGRFDIDHHPFLHPLGRVGTDTDDFNAAIRPDFPDDRHHLGCTDIQPDDHFLVLHAAHGSVSPVLLAIYLYSRHPG